MYYIVLRLSTLMLVPISKSLQNALEKLSRETGEPISHLISSALSRCFCVVAADRTQHKLRIGFPTLEHKSDLDEVAVPGEALGPQVSDADKVTRLSARQFFVTAEKNYSVSVLHGIPTF
jgi:hypothetical protein